MAAAFRISERVYKKMFEKLVYVDFVCKKECAEADCVSRRCGVVGVDDAKEEDKEPDYPVEN